VGGGRIVIRSSRSEGLTVIEVADDGSGMLQSELDPQRWGGIGLRNVDERLRVIYGENYHLKIESVRGEGTCARIEIPDLDVPLRVSA
jgi:sensor histidine kinase YesM